MLLKTRILLLAFVFAVMTSTLVPQPANANPFFQFFNDFKRAIEILAKRLNGLPDDYPWGHWGPDIPGPPPPPPDPPDDCDDCPPIDGDMSPGAGAAVDPIRPEPLIYHLSNVGADLEAGEPTVGGLMTRSIWAKFKTEAAGRIVIHTFGSEINTVLA